MKVPVVCMCGEKMFIWTENVRPDMLNDKFLELLREQGVIY